MLADLRLALRQFVRAPGHTSIVVAILALGIGANAAIFSLLHSVLLNPLPYPHADRLMLLWQTDRGRDISVSWPTSLDWRAQNRTFTEMGAYQRGNFTLTGRGAAERIAGARVTASYFPAVGLQPELGRFFTAEEDTLGGPPVALISHRLWQRKFDGDPGVLGQAINLNGQAYTIIGVLPNDWALPRGAELWISLTQISNSQAWEKRTVGPGIFVLGRLKPDATVEQANADIRGISAQIAQSFPDLSQTSATVQPLLEASVGTYRAPLFFLMGAVGLLLLIACANVAGLQLARSLARTREFSIRAALGSGRTRLLRQQLIESLVYALAGGVLGVLLAESCLGLVRAWSPNIPRFQEVSVSAPVLGFSFALASLTSVLAGLWPAWRASRADVREALQSGNYTGTSGPQAQLGRQLVVGGQVALTLMLLAGALLFARSLQNIARFQWGFDPSNLLVFRVNLPESMPAYQDPGKRIVFYDRLREELAALPGVKSAGYNLNTPLRTQWQTTFDLADQPAFAPGTAPTMELGFASPHYFETMGLPILRGRNFGAPEKRGSPASIIVDQAFADKMWPGEDPIGKAIIWGGDFVPGGPRITVVGVVPTLQLSGFGGGPRLLQGYVANSQLAASVTNFVLRTTVDPHSLVESARGVVARLDPNLAVFDVATMEDMIAESSTTQRLSARLVALFGGVALLLSSIGLYGIVAYAVRARQRELGVRLAIGAQPRQVVGLVLRQGAKPLALGIIGGLVGAFAAGQFVQGLLYETKAADPLMLAASMVVLALIAFVALWLPARRAAKIDPMKALRTE